MIARVLVLAVLLAGLVAWERALARRAESARERATATVGRMVSQAELEALDRAAFRLEWGDGRPPLTLVLSRGIWRLLEAYQVPADARALEALYGVLTSAEGYVQSEDPAQARQYGFGTAETFRFSICGRNVLADPTGDVLWSVDVGRSRSGDDGAFLRPQGSARIWAVDRDPRAILDGATRPGLPPLIDPSLLGQAWQGAVRGVERVRVDHADGAVVDLQLRLREGTEEELRDGAGLYEWVVDPEGEALVPPQGRPIGYLAWLRNAGFEGILDPRRAEELGLGAPRATVTLFPAAAGEDAGAQVPPLVLRVLSALGDGRVPVANVHANAIYVLPRGFDALVAPVQAQLVDPSSENLWDRELTKLHAQER